MEWAGYFWERSTMYAFATGTNGRFGWHNELSERARVESRSGMLTFAWAVDSVEDKGAVVSIGVHTGTLWNLQSR